MSNARRHLPTCHPHPPTRHPPRLERVDRVDVGGGSLTLALLVRLTPALGSGAGGSSLCTARILRILRPAPSPALRTTPVASAAPAVAAGAEKIVVRAAAHAVRARRVDPALNLGKRERPGAAAHAAG